MNKVNKHQREKVQQFVIVTGSSDRTALATLKAADWNVEGALEYFYNSAHALSPHISVDTRKIDRMFQKYKDPQSDMILVEGITLLCEDLQVDPADIVTLVLSWHMKASTACEFSKTEFTEGLVSLGVDSIEKLKAALPGLRLELKDENKFKEIYNFTFGWAKEKGQKSLALDTAIPMWKLLFEERQWPHVNSWCHFIEVKHNKAISKDTWTQLLEFARNIRPDLSNYDQDGAWPYLIDEYVDFLKEKS